MERRNHLFQQIHNSFPSRRILLIQPRQKRSSQRRRSRQRHGMTLHDYIWAPISFKSYKTILSPIRGPTHYEYYSFTYGVNIMKINIISTSSHQTGIGRYTVDLFRATQPYSNLTTFIINKKVLNQQFEGKIVKGIFPPFLESGWFINKHLFKIIFYKEIQKLKDNSILHFSSQFEQFFEFNKTINVVTIHDIFPHLFKADYSKSFTKTFYDYFNRYKNLIVYMNCCNFEKILYNPN